MRKIVLIGAGGLAAEMVEVIKMINRECEADGFDIQGFVVEEQYYKENSTNNGLPVLGTLEWLIEHKEEVATICAIGIPAERARLQKKLMQQGIEFVNIICPGVYISETAVIGTGVYMTGGSCVSSYCKIGDGVILNGGVIIGHDTSVGAYTCMMTRSDTGGRCFIGEEILIGSHAYIVPDRKIGDKATIAAGSIVFNNVKAGTTVLGNPAKRLKCLE